MEELQEKYKLFEICENKNCFDVFAEGNENVLGKPEHENLEKLLIDEYCPFKGQGYAHKTIIQEEIKLQGPTKWTLFTISIGKYVDGVIDRLQK